METGKQKRYFQLIIYELLGTALITYGVVLDKGTYLLGIDMTAIMMLLAWNISGGHFNPAITLGVYIAEKKFGENAMTMLVMIAAQFVGAFLGIFIGWLAVLDSTWADNYQDMFPKADVSAKVPSVWLGIIAPLLPDFTADVDNGFSRDW